MSFELSFSPEFFMTDDEFNYEKPFTVEQAINAMPDYRFAELAREVFGCEPQFLTAETVMEKIEETNTCGTLSSPVDVWIDPEGYFRVNVYNAPEYE